MTRVRIGVFLCFLFMGWGCAPVELPAPGPRHPANPGVVSAPLYNFSGVLHIKENNLPLPPPEMLPGGKMNHKMPHKKHRPSEKEDEP